MSLLSSRPVAPGTVAQGLRGLLSRLIHDETGAVLTAEAAMVGTIAIVGVGAGLSTLADAVNEELGEVAFAIRSLDQSYAYEGRSGCGAATAGSQYIQPDVDESLEALSERYEDRIDDAEATRERLMERQREALENEQGDRNQDGVRDGRRRRFDDRRSEVTPLPTEKLLPGPLAPRKERAADNAAPAESAPDADAPADQEIDRPQLTAPVSTDLL